MWEEGASREVSDLVLGEFGELHLHPIGQHAQFRVSQSNKLLQLTHTHTHTHF